MTSWTVASQAPLSMGFFRQEYWKVKVKVTQSCPTLCKPMDYTVHIILQARILEWATISFSRGSSWPRDWTRVSCNAESFFTDWESVNLWKCIFKLTYDPLTIIFISIHFIFQYKFIYFNWSLITLQYCIGFVIHNYKIYLEVWLKGKNRFIYSSVHNGVE